MGAFEDCTGLTSVTIPNSLTEINWSAFDGCTSMNTIISYIREPQNLNSSGYVGRTYKDIIKNSCTIQVPLGTIELYKSSFPWYLYTNIVEFDYSSTNENHTETLPDNKNDSLEFPDYNIDLLKQQYQNYNNNGYYYLAIETRNQLLQDPKFLTDSANLDFIIDIAFDFASAGEIDNAIACYTASCEIYNDLKDYNCEKVAEIQNMIGYYYSRLNDYGKARDYDKAIVFYEAALETYKRISEDNSISIAKLYENIGNCYISKDEYDNSISYYSKAAELYEQALTNYENKDGNQVEDDEATYYLNSISNIYLNLCKCHVATEQFKEASHWYLCYLNFRSLESRDDILGPNSLIRKPIIKRYEYYYNKKKYDAAIKYCFQVLLFYKNTIGNVYDVVAEMNEKLGKCYYAKQDYINAIRYYKEALNMLSPEVDYYEVTDQLNEDLAICYLSQRDYVQAYNYLKKEIDYKHKNVITFFNENNLQNCSQYWEKESSLFQDIYPATTLETYEQATGELYDRGEMLGDLYNKSALFAKGLLLASELEFSRIIHESKNPNLIRKYQELNKNKKYNEAKGLLDIAGEYGDYMKNLQLTWQDVQSKLGDNDIAIEFLSFPKFGTNDTVYIALTIRNNDNYKQPHLIEICNESDLKNLKESAYTDTALSEKIWGKLAEELMPENGDTVKNIYFSPSGLLHTIAIESMPHWKEKNKMMYDCFNIYRLTSTRELAMKHKPVEGTSGALLYGGFNYSCPIAEMAPKVNEKNYTEMTSADNDATTNDDFAYNDTNLDIGFRLSEPVTSQLLGGQWDNLASGIAVVNFIEGLLKQKKYPVMNVPASEALETSFKILSKNKAIIVLYTHGFYWDIPKAMQEIKDLKDPGARQEDHERILPFIQMDDAMTRCGLVFNGGNNVRNKDTKDSIPAGYDDGILTAREVANLDLRGLELIILSACQTALGEVNGEGVFGLQRGFKKAGAQSIIMSLWEVNPQATATMIQEFFKAWKGGAGMSKREAFVIAQNEVKKEYGNKYDDKKHKGPHWAAFILLDAIDE